MCILPSIYYTVKDLSRNLERKAELLQYIQACTKWCHQSKLCRTKTRTTVLITSHMGIINLNNVLHKIRKDFYAVFTYIEVDTRDIPQLLTYAYTHILISVFRVWAPNNQSLCIHICLNYLFFILIYQFEIDYFLKTKRAKAGLGVTLMFAVVLCYCILMLKVLKICR